MAKSPFYKVLIEKTGEDITEFISSLSHEDCLQEDDLVKLSVQGVSFEVVDKDIFDIGVELVFQYGFIGAQASKKHYCVITESDCDYDGGRANMTVSARDLGFYAKKITSSYVYKNKTASEIAEDIAAKFGLEAKVEKTAKKYESIPMGNKNFLDFLKELAAKEGAEASSSKGTIEVYVRSKTLFFARRDLSKSADRHLSYGDGNGIIKDFNISNEDVTDGASESASVSGIDSETGKPFTATAKAGDNKEAATGDKSLHFDVNGNLKAGTGDAKSASSGKNVAAPAASEQEAKEKAGAANKDAKAKIMKATIELELDVTFEAGQIVTISGVAQKHAGNWRIEKCTHKVDGGGGSTSLECYRNGAKKAASTTKEANAGASNTSKGSEEGSVKKEIQVRNFDKNGNRI